MGARAWGGFVVLVVLLGCAGAVSGTGGGGGGGAATTGDFVSGATTGVTQTSNLTRTGAAAATFLNPGAPPNGAVAVDLHAVAALAAQVVNQGSAFTCPTGWTCPAVWGTALLGTLDAAGNPRVNGAVDLGAYEQ